MSPNQKPKHSLSSSTPISSPHLQTPQTPQRVFRFSTPVPISAPPQDPSPSSPTKFEKLIKTKTWAPYSWQSCHFVLPVPNTPTCPNSNSPPVPTSYADEFVKLMRTSTHKTKVPVLPNTHTHTTPQAHTTHQTSPFPSHSLYSLPRSSPLTTRVPTPHSMPLISHATHFPFSTSPLTHPKLTNKVLHLLE